LGLIYTLGPSNLYAVLHALEGLGYVHAKISRVSSGPPRKIFRLTRAGKNAFRRWLDQPVRRIRQVRQDFLLKLFFSQHLPGHDTRALLDRQIAACRAYLRELEQADARAPLDGFRSLVLSSRRKAAEATIAWLVEQRRTLHPGTLLAARA
jgi:PadR family transcriptional regulator AphA